MMLTNQVTLAHLMIWGIQVTQTNHLMRPKCDNEMTIILNRPIIKRPLKLTLFHTHVNISPITENLPTQERELKLLMIIVTINKKHVAGREPWSSGYERRLMFQRSWVQIPELYTGWTFFRFI